jgi:poly(ADP-ribose) glycohydrolase
MKIVCRNENYCILKYEVPTGHVTFTRQFLDENDFPDFKNSKKTFRKAIIMNDGTIEDCIGTLQLDFANKYLGGGVLNSGCVQEEIRFVICPELIVSMLFSESMLYNESFVVRGCERFSSYKGYGDSFEWGDDYVDEVARDNFNRLYTDILAIDALCFRYPKMQFNESKVLRELIKCYSGFKTNSSTSNLPAVSTGNWGCGVYRGDRQLKCIISILKFKI